MLLERQLSRAAEVKETALRQLPLTPSDLTIVLAVQERVALFFASRMTTASTAILEQVTPSLAGENR